MENQKKILYIITKSVWGGAQKYVFDLATNLSRDEFEIFVAAGPAPPALAGWCGASDQGSLIQKIKEANLPYFEIKNFQRDINFLKEILAFFEILKLIKKIKPDLIHVSSSKAGGIAGLAAKFYSLLITHYSLPAVFTAHGWGFNEPRPKWQIWLIKLASKITAKFYDKIICVSEFDRQSALENKIAKPEKLIAIHNGIEQIEFLSREEAQQKLLGKTSPYVIGTIAEWTKNKGLFSLLEAVTQINKENLSLVLIGSGENPDKEKIYGFIKNNRLNNVYAREWINKAARYLKAFDIFILPSLKEGLPYTLLEAGLAELPVVATNVGGVPEIIENEKTGILVEPAKAEELKNAVEKLLTEPKLAQKLASNLHQKIILEFSLEKMLEKTINVYSTLNSSLDLRR
ncbi:MAG: glycosyltransferase family 4 protein [Patescibacteria group bacterium]